MSFRDWVYVTLTNLFGWMAAVGDDGITRLWYFASDQYWGLVSAHQNVSNGVRWFFSWIPDLLGFARDWLTSLLIGYVVDPVYTVLIWPFVFVMDRINDLWWSAYQHYTPVKNGLDLLYGIRDRLINLIDFTTDTVNGAKSFLTGLLTDAYNTLMGFVNGAVAALNAWASWVEKTVWQGVLGLTAALTDTNRALTQVYNDVEAIRRDPVGWIWDNVEPALQRLVEDWLNRIWYT